MLENRGEVLANRGEMLENRGEVLASVFIKLDTASLYST